VRVLVKLEINKIYLDYIVLRKSKVKIQLYPNIISLHITKFINASIYI